MHLRIHRTDGKTGSYHQKEPARAALLLKKLDPRHIFSSGPIVIGTHNPFSVLNPDDICWIEIETNLPTSVVLPDQVDQVRRLSGREEYEALLSTQWPQWMKFKMSKEGDLLEALVELSLRGGESLFLHVTGKVTKISLVDAFFGAPVIPATFAPHGTVYINTKTIVRARVYHSKDKINYPPGLWFAEADDI